jgi:hypothetical protein
MTCVEYRLAPELESLFSLLYKQHPRDETHCPESQCSRGSAALWQLVVVITIPMCRSTLGFLALRQGGVPVQDRGYLRYVAPDDITVRTHTDITTHTSTRMSVPTYHNLHINPTCFTCGLLGNLNWVK